MSNVIASSGGGGGRHKSFSAKINIILDKCDAIIIERHLKKSVVERAGPM
jgi:hypothetical protein